MKNIKLKSLINESALDKLPLTESIDVKYFERSLDKIVDQINNLHQELSDDLEDNNAPEAYYKFTTKHIDTILYEIEKLKTTIKKTGTVIK